jgi:hypothetical protein
MTPKHFKKCYENLNVSATHPNGNYYCYNVPVTKYRMNSPSKQTDRQVAMDAIRSSVNAKNRSFQTSAPDSLGWSIPIDNAAFNCAKLFRATPTQREYILNSAIQCGYFKDTSTKTGKLN